MCVVVDTSCLAISKVMSKKSDSLVQWFIFYVKFFIFRVQFLLTSADMLGFVVFRVEGGAKCGTPFVQYYAPFAGV